MRMSVLAALFTVGVALTGVTGASAANIGSGININAATTASLLEQVQYGYGYRHRRHCRSVKVCRRGPYGRRCHVERVCRRW